MTLLAAPSYVRTEVALQGLENRFEPRGGGPSQQATLPTANPMQQVGGSQGGPTWQQQQMSGMGIVGAPGAMGLNPLMQGQSMSSVPPMMGAMPASSSGMAAMAPGGQSGIVGGMSAVSRPQTSGGDGLGPSVSQRGSVAHTSRSAATSVLSIRDLREPSNRGSREDILRTVFDKVDTAGVYVKQGWLCVMLCL